MPKACVKKKMKQGMSAGKAVAACYPRATKAAKKVIISAMKVSPAGAVVRAGEAAHQIAKKYKKRRTIKEIKKSKPPKMKIRKGHYGVQPAKQPGSRDIIRKGKRK